MTRASTAPQLGGDGGERRRRRTPSSPPRRCLSYPQICRRTPIISYGGSTWIFYGLASAGTVSNPYTSYLAYEKTDGNYWLQGYVETLGQNEFIPPRPVAFAFNGTLQVALQGRLGVQVMTLNSWGSFDQQHFISGDQLATAIVDTQNDMLHVFHFNPASNTLLSDDLPAGGSWSTSTVDTDFTSSEGSAAAVMHGGTTQVYYTGGGDGIRGATFENGAWVWQAEIDGTSSSTCSGQGGTTHSLGGPIAIVEADWGPHLYYTDLSTGDLRTAFWH